MINVSQTIKNSCKADKNTHTEYIVINGQTIYISGKLSATAYKDTTFFGTFNMKVLQFETENSTQFRNREFEYYKVIDGNAFKVGSFITTQVVDNDSKENIKVTANDYALKFAIPYTSQLDYESEQVTLYDVLKECCDNAGVELENEYITNGTFVVDNNQFVNGEMIGDVICAIAGISGNFATITDNDKLKLTFLNGTGELQTTTIDGSSTINASELKDIELKAKTTQASTPNPNYPQEVVNVTGRQEIITCGKNLLNKDNWVSGYYNSSGIWNTSTTNATFDYISAIPNAIYTLSTRVNCSFLAITEFNSSKTFIKRTQVVNNNINTITTDSNTKYIRVTINRNNADITQEVIDNITPQLEYGSSIDYEPYQEQVNEINLGKNLFIPTTQVSGTDIVVANGTVTLNNDEFTLNATGNDCYFGQVSASGNAYTNNRGILIDVSGMTNVTFSLTNTQFNNIYITAYNNSKTSLGYTNFTSYKGTYTIPTNAKYISIRFGLSNAVSGTSYSTKVQIEKGTQATSYSEYFTPIELCKIGNYEDKIFKTSGKNLSTLDHYTNNVTSVYYVDKKLLDNFENNTTYTLSFDITSSVTPFRISVGYGNSAFQADMTNGTLSNQTNGHIKITFTTDNTTYSNLWIRIPRYTSTTTYQTSVSNIMLVKGTQEAEYEPFGSNNEWYVKKAIGKVVLDGSENWNNDGGTQGTDYRHNIYYAGRMTIPTALGTNNTYLSNYFTPRNSGSDAGELGSFYMSNSWLVFVDKNKVYDLAQWKTWLGTNKPIVYYVLATPTYEKLNDELQKQLSDIKTMPLFSGVNNITTTAPFNITYIDNNIEILEDYTDLDDKRDTQPITSVSIGTSQVEGQEAVLKDEGMIALYGEHWLILNDNPFGYTLEKRQELVVALFNKVKGFGYSSFTSKYTYRPYLELGDKIKFKNKAGNLIDSVILRYEMDFDDCTFEAPSITSASIDYEAIPSTEVLARRAEIIANQAEAQISVIATEQNNLEGRVETAEGKLTSAEATLTFIEENTLNEDGSVKSLSTPNTTNTTTYTFDKNGIKIGKSTDNYNSLQDNTGTYYYEKDTMIGKYTKDGSVQKDLALFGKYYYGIDEEGFNVESFTREDALFLAQMYTDSEGEKCFGHFYNGN